MTISIFVNDTTYGFNGFFMVLLQVRSFCVQRQGKIFLNLKIPAKFSYIKYKTYQFVLTIMKEFFHIEYRLTFLT